MALSLGSTLFAQSTWMYGECDHPATGGPRPGLVNYATDSDVPTDPVVPGARSGSIYPTTQPVSLRDSSEGAVTVDKINKVLYVTDGDLNGGGAGNLVLEIHPLPGDSCAPGAGPLTMTVTGTYPFIYNVTGMAIEYRTNQLTGRDEPYRMWCTAGRNTGSTNGYGEYHWFWLTPNPPAGETQGAWATGPARRPALWFGNMRDIVFGYYKEQGRPVSPVLIAVLGGSGPQNQLMVLDPVTNTNMLMTSVPGTSEITGIALDSSMPIDLLNSTPTNPTFFVPGYLSGRVLISMHIGGPGTPNAPQFVIRDVTSDPNAPRQWLPAGLTNCSQNPYYGDLAYSGEFVTAATSPGAARMDTLLTYPPGVPPVNPPIRQDPAQTGQLLSKANGGPMASIQTIGCNYPPGLNATNSTAVCLVSENKAYPWVDPITGVTLAVTPPSAFNQGTAAVALMGGFGPGPNLVSENSLFTSPALSIPAAQLPAAPYGVTTSPQYYTTFCQWVFLSGVQTTIPNNFAGLVIAASEAKRVVLSNPN